MEKENEELKKEIESCNDTIKEYEESLAEANDRIKELEKAIEYGCYELNKVI